MPTQPHNYPECQDIDYSQPSNKPDYDQLLHYKIKLLLSTYYSESIHTEQLIICQQRLMITFVEPELAKHYMPALQHLRAPQAMQEPDFSLYVIDVANIENKKHPSLAHFLTDFFNHRAHPPTKVDGQYSHFLAFDDFAYYYNHHSRWGVWFVFQAQSFSQWHFANPFRFFLYDWLLHKQYQLLHTSAITDGKSALLFAGSSGSGKSTTALLGLKAGYRLLGDDHCAVSITPEPKAFSLYNAIKLDEFLMANEFKEFKPYIASFIHTQKIKKAIINLATINDDFMSDAVPVKALICLKINKNLNQPILKTIDGATALKQVLLTTMEQCAWVSRKQIITNIQKFVSQVPCYHLTLCPTHQQNLSLIGSLFNA